MKQVVLDENAVTGKGAPILIYEEGQEADDAQATEAGEPSRKLKGAA